VWIDGSCIAHVVNPPAEEGLDGCPEVECDHTRCYRPHTRRLHACCGSLVGCLRALGGAFSGRIFGGSDSSAGTGAGCHRRAWDRAKICRYIGGRRGWRLTLGRCAWACHKRISWFRKDRNAIRCCAKCSRNGYDKNKLLQQAVKLDLISNRAHMYSRKEVCCSAEPSLGATFSRYFHARGREHAWRKTISNFVM
jgi:hypothetical protein